MGVFLKVVWVSWLLQCKKNSKGQEIGEAGTAENSSKSDYVCLDSYVMLCSSTDIFGY